MMLYYYKKQQGFEKSVYKSYKKQPQPTNRSRSIIFAYHLGNKFLDDMRWYHLPKQSNDMKNTMNCSSSNIWRRIIQKILDCRICEKCTKTIHIAMHVNKLRRNRINYSRTVLTPMTSNCRCSNSSDCATFAVESFRGNTSNKMAAAFARTLGLATYEEISRKFNWYSKWLGN